MSRRSSSAAASSGGIGLFGAIFIVFLVLKLVGIAPVASWSWWWVTAPIWGPLALVVLVLAIAGIVWVLCRAMGKVWSRR